MARKPRPKTALIASVAIHVFPAPVGMFRTARTARGLLTRRVVGALFPYRVTPFVGTTQYLALPEPVTVRIGHDTHDWVYCCVH